MKLNHHLLAASWLEYKPLFVDTETTGLGNTAELVEIAIITTNGEICFHSLVRPYSPIMAAATRIHGLTNDHVARAPTAPRIWSQLTTLLSSQHLVIYNAAFDERILKQTAYAWRLPLIRLGPLHDAMALFSAYYGDTHSWTCMQFQPMKRAIDHFGIKIKHQHRALADAEATRQILYALLTTPRNHEPTTQARTDT